MTIEMYHPDATGPIPIAGHFGEPPLAVVQSWVGGDIEVVYSVEMLEGDAKFQMVLNENGKVHGLPRNMAATAFAHAHHMIATEDFIVGPAVVLSGRNRLT